MNSSLLLNFKGCKEMRMLEETGKIAMKGIWKN
jgi:hypothetical protein